MKLASHVLFQVQFEVADATKRTFPEGTFDIIYSRDTILHIDDKLALFKRFHVSVYHTLDSSIKFIPFLAINFQTSFESFNAA